ncbi:MAG TPA: NAD(P)H-dependent glycerol-3-phosphate dehydrogenase [Candidatus Udaeobacter sp.]|nr:NAD(P)H-dependent glycerol-3-phosphate dehydrogenase [Candidatus Udaeobacter sp.]
MSRIAILGGGSWGTGLAVVLASSRRKHEIRLWVRAASLADSIERDRENKKYLPGIPIPPCVKTSSDLENSLHEAQIVVGAVPSAHTRSIFALALPNFSRDAVFVSATKGLEPATHLRMSEVTSQVINSRFLARVAVLSGPSFAAEAAQGHPTAVVLASADASLGAFLQEEFSGPTFRLYTNDDVLGVELAGAMKNVVAIAAGACQGLALGANSLAALITRGLAEMSRLAVALGGKPETLSGLAGMGDLILTCYGTQSRNRRVGFELGQGRSLQQILAGMSMVAEGVGTTAALLALAKENHLELPIAQQVHSILNLGNSPREAIRAIMERPLKRE